MGQTNIRSAGELLSRAQPQSHNQVAVLPEAGQRNQHMKTGAFTQDDLDRHVAMLNIPPSMQDRWVQSTKSVWTQNVPSFNIPKTRLTPGLGKFWIPDVRNYHEECPQPEGLQFIAIVQGSPGASIQKVYVANSRDAIGNSIFHEAINGYSTVFSGAFFKMDLDEASRLCLDDTSRLPSPKTVQWKQIESLEALIGAREKNKDNALADGDGSMLRPQAGIIC